jgi:hypothetical protein
MAFENELQSFLGDWITQESKDRSHHILNGSCNSIEEYKARCAELNTLWAVGEKINEFVRGPTTEGQENGES